MYITILPKFDITMTQFNNMLCLKGFETNIHPNTEITDNHIDLCLITGRAGWAEVSRLVYHFDVTIVNRSGKDYIYLSPMNTL